MAHLRQTIKHPPLSDSFFGTAIGSFVIAVMMSIVMSTKGCTDMRTHVQKKGDVAKQQELARRQEQQRAAAEMKTEGTRTPVVSEAEKEYWRLEKELTERRKPDLEYQLGPGDVTPWVSVERASRGGSWISRCTARCEFLAEWDDGKRTADFNEPGKTEFLRRPGHRMARLQWVNQGQTPIMVRIWYYGKGPDERRERAAKETERGSSLRDFHKQVAARKAARKK